MPSLSVAGDYQVLGRCNDIDGTHVYAGRRTTDKSSDRLFSLFHFPVANPSAEKELRALTERTRRIEDPILVVPREIVRTDQGLFVVTDFVAGETLDHIVKSNRAAIAKILAVAIARDIGRAVERVKERTGRAMVGEVTTSNVLVSYETGELKAIMVGAPLLQGRSVFPTTKSIGSLLYEMLTGKRPHGSAPPAPKGGADLDRIVLNAISFASEDITALAEELHNYLRTRTIDTDRSGDLKKLIQQYFSHKSTAMRALVQRWRSQTLPPRSTSVPGRSVSVPPRPVSLRPIRKTSGVQRPVGERSLEAALAEPDIVILDPEELVATDDISSASLRRSAQKRYPRLRLAFFMFLLSLSFATVALVLANGEGSEIVRTWTSIFRDLKQLLSSFR